MPGFLAMVAAYEALAAGIDGGVKLAGHFNSPDKQSVLRLYADMAITAASPWNTFIGNPAAQREAFRTSGGSLINGLVNFWTDARHHNGFPLLSDGSFEVGVNSGDTPGDVVFSNGLIELIPLPPHNQEGPSGSAARGASTHRQAPHHGPYQGEELDPVHGELRLLGLRD